jgi:hypothetical protein
VKVYAFDVDETLEISGGPIRMAQVEELRTRGHVIGICGNLAPVLLKLKEWPNVFSFIGPIGLPKEDFLRRLRQVLPAEDHVMVGNVLGVSGASDDKGAAERSGWRFIKESAFAIGDR